MPTLRDIFEEVEQGTFQSDMIELNYQDIGESECIEICEKLKDFSIKRLNLANNKLNDNCIKILLDTFTRLEELNVSCNAIGDSGASLISLNHTIADLNVSECNISRDGAVKLFSKPKLKKLNLMENKIGDNALINIHENKTLTSLDLTSTGITKDGAFLIAKNSSLEELNLAYNGLGNEGGQALSKHPALQSLDLTDNGIGDNGAIALAKNKKLKSLTLFNNKITNEGFMAFCENKSLIFINISSNKLQGNILNRFLCSNSSLLEIVAENNRISEVDNHLLETQQRKIDLTGNPIVGAPLLIGYKRKASRAFQNDFPDETNFELEGTDDYAELFSASTTNFPSSPTFS